jgi:hypothetical protein
MHTHYKSSDAVVAEYPDTVKVSKPGTPGRGSRQWDGRHSGSGVTRRSPHH